MRLSSACSHISTKQLLFWNLALGPEFTLEILFLMIEHEHEHE
jgi:hypothetical protein